jgi:hypothetical protein
MITVEAIQEEVDRIINSKEPGFFTSPVNRGVLHDNLKVVEIESNNINKRVDWEAEFDLNYQQQKIKINGSGNNINDPRSLAITIVQKANDAIELNK